MLNSIIVPCHCNESWRGRSSLAATPIIHLVVEHAPAQQQFPRDENGQPIGLLLRWQVRMDCSMTDFTPPTSRTPVLSRTVYRLRVEGRLDELAFDYVDDVTLALAIAPSGQTVTTLTCTLKDQESLVGLINLLHDFGLRLISVERIN